MKWEDYGESSLTLLAAHCGIDKDQVSVPRDPSDFKRCIHLFKCLNFGEGEIFNLLCVTANKYPIWKPFAENWDELTELYEEEKNLHKAPKLYEAIQNLQ